ncbi:MAG: three-Cys-motif partner protein TcmP, partial [bacterium]
MQKNPCTNCNHEATAPEGLCHQSLGSDGELVRCVGKWSRDKHFYLQRYLDIFTTSMRKKWILCYLDMFAGPGRCKIREISEEITASPLIALGIRYPFNQYIFIDENPKVCNVLKKRVEIICDNGNIDARNVIIKNGDCNHLVAEICDLLPDKSLSICFIDPTGLQLKFSTVRSLATRNRKIDLIINFPLGTALKRNIEQFYQRKSPIMNEFWGDDSWRGIYESLPQGVADDSFTVAFIKGYRDRLTPLGYQEVKLGSEVGIKHYYYLLFVSKHLLGQKFWQEVIK